MFPAVANLTAHIKSKHEKTTWPCEHCPLVLSSQSSRIRHRQRKHGYEKRERAAALYVKDKKEPSSEALVASHITSRLDKLKQISSRIEHFIEELTDLAVKPLAPGMDTLVAEPARRANMDAQFQFDWSSEVTTSTPECPALGTSPNSTLKRSYNACTLDYPRVPPRTIYTSYE
ncbi:hypothetical protein CPB85DRAFT_1249341 [Mucidula mucida]|nr:hypothetical protein CPB85DRAFT_1249341 [Mucidula mucida]